MGPMSGRGAGYCAGFAVPGYANPVAGRGFGFALGFGRGFGRGGGRGRRNMYYATGLPGWARFGGYAAACQKPDPEMERQALKNDADALQSQLDLIKQRLTEIESSAPDK